MQRISTRETDFVIRWIEICLVDSVVQLSNNLAQYFCYPWLSCFEGVGLILVSSKLYPLFKVNTGLELTTLRAGSLPLSEISSSLDGHDSHLKANL